jgi:hypothetical protein
LESSKPAFNLTGMGMQVKRMQEVLCKHLVILSPQEKLPVIGYEEMNIEEGGV